MTALSEGVTRNWYGSQETALVQAAAGVQIFVGAYVGKNPAGFVKPFEPGDLFVGIALDDMDNSASGAADGDVTGRVRTTGDFELALSGATDEHIGHAVYATDDNTLALTGHRDAFVGRIVASQGTEITNGVRVRLKALGERPNRGEGSQWVETHFTGSVPPTGADGASDGSKFFDGLEFTSALGLGVLGSNNDSGEAVLQFDGQAEIAHAAIFSGINFPITGAITMRGRLHVEDHGDHAALDFDFGLVDAITANTKADMGHGDLTKHFLVHMDGSSDNILASSDDNASPVTATDTGVDNVEAAGSFKDFKLIVRKDGSCELWIDGARVLSSTAFSVGSSADNLGLHVNLEKTSNDTTAKVVIDYLDVAGEAA